MFREFYITSVCLLIPLCVQGEEQAVPTARPIPLTRPAMKQQLEDLKGRTQRIPLPEVKVDATQGDMRQFSYEMRLREAYLPPGTPSVVYANMLPPPGARPDANAQPRNRDFSRNADEAMTLTYAFKTRLFWIVSRTNNCHYCLGHQEQKLSAVGMTDDQIAALDFDWLQHPENERPAFAYARKLTWEPHRLTDADFTELRKFYTDMQILEMTLSVSWNNSINRWKEGLGVPQSQHGDMFFRNKSPDIPADRPLPIDTFLTPTSDELQASVSLVAAVPESNRGSASAASGYNTRPKLESADSVREQLVADRVTPAAVAARRRSGRSR